MNKRQAQQIINSGVTHEQIRDIMKRAADSGEWVNSDKKSVVNPALTKADAFRLFSGATQGKTKTGIVTGLDRILAKNVLREFGQYYKE